MTDPKPFSAVWAVADPEVRKVLNDLRREVIADAVIPYLESLCATRRGKGGHVVEPVKIAVGVFSEGASRANQPQTHHHLVLSNLGVRADGTTGTILSKPIYTHQGAINALYMCELSRLLEQRLGLRCDRVGQWFEVRGVSQELCKMWSARKAQIDRAVKDRGASSAFAREVAALATRKAKALHLGEGELLRRWRDEARPYALTPDAVRGMLGRVKHADPAAEVKRVVETALARLDETHSHFGHRDLLRAAWTEAIGRGLSAGRVREAVDDTLAQSPAVTRLGHHRGEERFATAAMLKLEERLLTAVDELAGTDRHTLRPAAVAAVLARRATLTDEQRAAVRAVTLAASGVAVVTGLPGSGKTHALSVVRECFEAAGYQLVGVALAGKAPAVWKRAPGSRVGPWRRSSAGWRRRRRTRPPTTPGSSPGPRSRSPPARTGRRG
ncbi:MAG: relaxase domain-containing protein [Gemmataceae bacterium]|nr:relaxase domain-containing protein [Gemmataceae bacterium]